jgi:hypothetical protein
MCANWKNRRVRKRKKAKIKKQRLILKLIGY